VVVAFEGRRDGAPVEGAASDRFALVIGSERMVPGFEDELVGLAEGESKTFTVRFPDDYAQADMAGGDVEFSAKIRELRERRLPLLDDAFAQSMGSFADVAALRDDLRGRMGRSALDRARFFARRLRKNIFAFSAHREQ
jgi:trigger factor